jgi:hypothetical protein
MNHPILDDAGHQLLQALFESLKRSTNPSTCLSGKLGLSMLAELDYLRRRNAQLSDAVQAGGVPKGRSDLQDDLFRAHRDLQQAYLNLELVQTRCTALLEVNRELLAQIVKK